ncbi:MULTISPECIES: hypothetical protein [unclassified Streptomyces]|uniref:hypothetical protein n=1 Tax=unclassified Streptomyces TaxID=2593676 RepID=UPI002253E79E|nr:MULTISPECIES: hypothetical protein [unclassified Streptomyces]MCX5332045.1 hypothetical protein [Streptomyces sp. NBC_00140]MCX5361446.1 hypothetical protein [Streptomyces sp. NBC_00124]
MDRVRVQDDGGGMSAEHCEEYFRPIGASWKNARGWVRAFALGTQVRWTSVSDAFGGRQHEFDIGDPEPAADPTGTLFEAFAGDEAGPARRRASQGLDGQDLDPAAEQLHVRDSVLGTAFRLERRAGASEGRGVATRTSRSPPRPPASA